MRSRDRRHAEGGHRYSGRVELAPKEEPCEEASTVKQTDGNMNGILPRAVS